MTTRKNFIGASALLAAAIPAASGAQTPPPVTPTFDLAQFNGDLGRKVTHKNLFAIRKVETASGLDAMESVWQAYSDIGTEQRNLLFAAVFYHGASIMFGFDDTIWDTYSRALLAKKAGKMTATETDLQTIIGDTKKGNPVKTRIATLAANANARFFVCNNALRGFSGYMADNLDLHKDDVYADHVKHLLPNVSLVPAGVWAVHAIQEHGFTLLHTT